MKTGYWIALGIGTALAASAVAYRNGLNKLIVDVHDVDFSGTDVAVVLSVYNPTGFSYPVPSMFFNIFDEDSNYMGSLRSDHMQWIDGNGYSYITAYLMPGYDNLRLILNSVTFGTFTGKLLISGVIKAGGYQLPIETEVIPEAPAVGLTFSVSL